MRTKLRLLVPALAMATILFAPGLAGAKSFSLDRVDIAARVEAEGGLWIDETRTYTFDGSYSWADFRLPLDRAGFVEELSVFEGDRAFRPEASEEPGTFQVESSPDELYVKWFYDARDETRSFRMSYRVTEAIVLHSDVAELYYQFVGALNPQHVGNVHVEVELPQPAVLGDVRVWAHGPLHGNVDFRNDGRLTFDITSLPAETMWEGRVVFPSDWMDGGRRAESTAPALGRILAEEERWVAEANEDRANAEVAARQRAERGRGAALVAVPLAGLALAVVVACFLVAGRPHRVPYDQELDSTLPEQPPALVSFFYNSRQVHGTALGATLFDLARRGVISLEEDPAPGKWYNSTAKFTLRLDRSGWHERKDELLGYENELVDFLFNEVTSRDTLHSKEIRKAHRKMVKWFREWKKRVRAEAGDYRLFDPTSIKMTVTSALVGAGTLVAGIVLTIIGGGPGVVAIVGGFVATGLSLTILRYTPEVKLERRKLEAFRRYLKKYHKRSGPGVGERVGEYLVYGIALGVGSKPIERLFESVPERDRGLWVPWYIHHSHSSPADFAHAMTSVVTAATSTVSSSAGAGGGATGGGGGGAGGGGGGAG